MIGLGRLKRLPAIAGAIAGLALAAALPAAAQDKLSYFTWDGYELPDFHKSFEAAHPNSLDVSKFGDDDEAFTKVKAGFRPDIAHPCYDKILRWKEAGLIEPIAMLGSADVERDVDAVFCCTAATMRRYMGSAERPGPGDIAHVVRFCLNGLEAN